MIESIWQEFRYSLRLLKQTPAFAIIAISSLALGTGANTALFQLLDSVRLRSLPVKASQELVEMRVDDMTHARGTWLRDAALTNPLWEEIRTRQGPFSGTFAWADEALDISQNGESRDAKGLWVSGDFFRVLGIQPLLGRVFLPRDDRRGCGLSPGAVISYGFWRQAFGGDPSLVGREVLLGKNRITIIGVTPPGFFGLEVGRTFDLALPICSEPAWHGGAGQLDSGITWWLTVMGRLRAGVSMQQASARLRTSSASIFETTLPKGYPPESIKPYLKMRLLARPAGHGLSHLREQYQRPLILLLAIAGLVLLITCANLASLMLARASARQREIAVRLAMGASRARLARHLLTESLFVAISGAVLGLLLARVLSRFLVSFLATAEDPVFISLPQDFHIFAFATLLAVLTCLLFSSMPVLRTARIEPGEVLKSGTRNTTTGRAGLGFRRALVAAQIALSLVLVMSSLLFVRSLRNLNILEPGFDPKGVLIADLNFAGLHLAPGRAVSFRQELLRRVRTIPGVEAAADATIIPLSGATWNNRVWMNGSDLAHARVSLRTMIGTGYFRTLNTPILAGRDFDEQDLGSFAKVAVVNQEFVREFLGEQSAVGRRFWIEATPYEAQTLVEIVGVVKNTKYHDLREEFQPIMFLPLSRAAAEGTVGRVLLRSRNPSAELITALRRTLAGTSPDIKYSFRFFDTWIQDSLLRERLLATLSGLFGLLAIVLTAVGLYGVISYTVTQRTKEIGIRIALGANRSSVMAFVMREASLVLVVGLGVGVLLTLAAGHAASALLFGLRSYDLATLVIAAISLSLVTAGASYLPARRASRMNPLLALRDD